MTEDGVSSYSIETFAETLLNNTEALPELNKAAEDAVRADLSCRLGFLYKDSDKQSTDNESLSDIIKNKHLIIVDIPNGYLDKKIYAILTVYIKALYDRFDSAIDKKGLRKTSIIIDEAPAVIGGSFSRIFATSRSRGIRITLSYQDIEQIKDNDREWVQLLENADSIVYLGGNGPSVFTADYLSKKAGSTTITEVVHENIKNEGDRKATKNRMLFSPEEIMRLPRGTVLILKRGEVPRIAKLENTD